MNGRFFGKHSVLKDCHIYAMLQSQKRHISFHTPGHKRAGWDITELGYTDNLAQPTGCILRAQADIARLVGAHKSFILTDGSTSGVLSMLHAFREAGYARLAIPAYAHKSVKNGCLLLGMDMTSYTAEEIFSRPDEVVKKADGLLLTSPDYYGNIPDLQKLKEVCVSQGKPLLIDGAHGGHLRGDKTLYAGVVADLWVDGVHKSLPALTQGAVVSAKTPFWAEKLQNAVDIFRTSSPSYPIMASVEYAVKYPENPALAEAVRAYAKRQPRVRLNEDWTKLRFLAGKHAFAVQTALESKGIFAEFCDGEVLLFYLSPATKMRAFRTLCKRLDDLAIAYPYVEADRVPAPVLCPVTGEKEDVDLRSSVGRVCAKECGLFPPCVPLLLEGEVITAEKVALLQRAHSTFGLTDGKITVLKDDAEE